MVVQSSLLLTSLGRCTAPTSDITTLALPQPAVMLGTYTDQLRLEPAVKTAFGSSLISIDMCGCRDLQSGTLFTNITIGPYARRGLFFNEFETRNIIRHYVSMVSRAN